MPLGSEIKAAKDALAFLEARNIRPFRLLLASRNVSQSKFDLI